jgi:Domain of unknown function (DUF4430)
VRRLALLALVLALAGCGGERGHGTATIWVTRDRGASLLHTEKVPAGLTAMQALDRVADVKTRYGGRFVQAIDGIEGDASKQRDWFYFVNGIEAGVGAAEYRLHAGDVEWWDFRSWRGRMREPVVVGAFPEPFVHGFGGKTHPTVVVYANPRFAGAARRLARIVHGRAAPRASAGTTGSNVVDVVAGSALRATGGTGGVTFTVGIVAARRLVADPTIVRYRYEGLP